MTTRTYSPTMSLDELGRFVGASIAADTIRLGLERVWMGLDAQDSDILTMHGLIMGSDEWDYVESLARTVFYRVVEYRTSE